LDDDLDEYMNKRNAKPAEGAASAEPAAEEEAAN
jgi:hypothetical protein